MRESPQATATNATSAAASSSVRCASESARTKLLQYADAYAPDTIHGDVVVGRDLEHECAARGRHEDAHQPRLLQDDDVLCEHLSVPPQAHAVGAGGGDGEIANEQERAFRLRCDV